MREEIVEWIVSHPNFKPSCVSIDVVTILNPVSNLKEVFPKMLMEIYIKDLHNDTIKPYSNGELSSVVNSMTQKLLISDRTLMSFIPPQVRNMTPELRHICGCEILIIPKDMYIDLNILRIKLITDFQHASLGRHTCNRSFSTTSTEDYKSIVFPDGECSHATIKDDAQCIYFIPIKPKNIINIKGDLNSCDECPD